MNIIRTLVATVLAAAIVAACAEGGPLVPTEIVTSSNSLPSDGLPPLGEDPPRPLPPVEPSDPTVPIDPPFPLPPIEDPVLPEPPLPADPPDDDGTVR